MRLPFNGTYRVNAPFGKSAAYGDKFHYGIDYNTPTGTQLYAAMSGKVTFSGNQPTTAGEAVTIQSGGTRVMCFHMSVRNVVVGQQVTEGQPIGKSGNTGNSTGPHLHFQVERLINDKWVAVDPLTELSKETVPMPNDGDIDNAYLRANHRKATEEEKAFYRSKPWSAPDGLFYGKTLVDFENTENAVIEARKSADSALGIANVRDGYLKDIGTSGGFNFTVVEQPQVDLMKQKISLSASGVELKRGQYYVK